MIKKYFWVPLIVAGLLIVPGNPLLAARRVEPVSNATVSNVPNGSRKALDSRRSRLVHVVQVDATANNGEYVGPEICELNCFAATASFTTVPYFSLDQPRTVTIVYNGDQAFPRPYIYADVNANDGTGVGVRFFDMSATLNGNPVTFITGGTTFRQSGSLSPTRITAEFDGAALSTNVYPLVVTVKATYNDNATAQTSRSASLLVVNETNSPVAKGWTVAGVQHLYSAIGGKYVATSGDGSAIAFTGLGVLALDYSKVTFDGATSTYTRTYNDGSRVIFNSVGQETSFIELDGRTYTFFYDPQGRLWSVRDPYRTQPDGTPASIGLAYDANGLHQIQEPGPDRWNWHGRNTWFVVDANRRLTSAQDPDGILTSYAYDASGRLSTVTDRRGSVTTLGYDSNSWKITSITLPQIAVDAGGGSTTLTTPVINLTPYQSGSPGAIVDEARRITTFTVNKYGQALDITAPYGQHTTIVRSGILPIRITHPQTGTDTLVYDSQGRVTKSHLAGEDSVKFSYTGFLLTTVTGPGSNSSVTYHYNASSKVDTVTRSGTPLQRTVLTYDNTTGLPATVSDQLHHQVTYLYDTNFGNVRSEVSPGNRSVTKIFDGFGRDSLVTPPTGAANVTVYDLMNRVTSDSAFTRKITFGYDQLYQTDLYDANGNHYHTDFNALGWPTRQCDAFALCSTTRYDASGALTSTTNRRNQVVSVTRDSLGRITSRTGPGLNPASYSYKSNGHDMVAWNSIETDSVYHNPGDKTTPATDSVITLIDLKRYKVFHGFPRQVGGVDSLDIRSNTNTMFDPRVTGYAPSGLLWYFRLGNSSIVFGPDADATGGMTNYPVSGLSRTSTALSTHKTNSVGWSFGVGSKLNRSYHYDLDNHIDQMMVGDPPTQLVFGYDALGQLVTRESRSGCSLLSSDSTSGYNYSCPTLVSSQTFSYDSMGNRRDMGGVPTTGNRYAAFNGATYSYDADGNVIHKSKPGVYDIYYYWNALSQLDSVVNNGYRTQFEYNAFDRPVRVKEGSSYPLQVQRYLLWDRENVLAQLDPAGQRLVDYSYLPGAPDHPIAYEHGATIPPAMAFVDVDEAGNVIGSSESGSVRQDNSYDAWGYVTSNLPTDQSLYWKGLFWNGPNTGLYYVRNRWYDPESGRFVSEDPAGFAGGDNLYTFADNDPINGRDPTGLTYQCIWIHTENPGWTESVNGMTVVHIIGSGNWACGEVSPTYPGATNSNPTPSGPNVGTGYGSGPAQSSPTSRAHPRNSADRTVCHADIRQVGWAAAGSYFQLGAYRFVTGFAKLASSEALWLSDDYLARFAANGMYLPALSAVKASEPSSPNPLQGTPWAMLYTAARNTPWLSVGVRIGEAINSCFGLTE
jgi:RHS repeat-associated protein